MKLSDYDKAVYALIHTVFENTVLSYQERQLWKAAEQEEDVTVKVPLIGINRVATTLELQSRGNEPNVRRGMYFHDTGSFLREIPVSLKYQLDFYSDSRDQCEELWREILRYLLDKRVVVIPSTLNGKDFVHEFPIVIEDSPVDNTNVIGFVETGKLYRVTQDFSIDNAVLLFEKKPEGEAAGLILKIPVKQVVLERKLEADSYTVSGV